MTEITDYTKARWRPIDWQLIKPQDKTGDPKADAFNAGVELGADSMYDSLLASLKSLDIYIRGGK